MASESFLARFRNKSSTMTIHKQLDVSQSKPVAKESPSKLHAMPSPMKKPTATVIRPHLTTLYSSISQLDHAIATESQPIRFLTPVRRNILNKSGTQEIPSTVFARASGFLLKTEPFLSELTERSSAAQTRKEYSTPLRLMSHRQSLSPMSSSTMSKRRLVSLRHGGC